MGRMRGISDIHTIQMGTYRVGFVESTYLGVPSTTTTTLELGPLGKYRCPVSAKTGASIAWSSLPMMAILACAVVLARRRNKT